MQPTLVINIADHFADTLNRVFALAVFSHRLYPVAEAAQLFHLSAAQILLQADFLAGAHQADTAVIGIGAQSFQY